MAPFSLITQFNSFNSIRLIDCQLHTFIFQLFYQTYTFLIFITCEPFFSSALQRLYACITYAY